MASLANRSSNHEKSHFSNFGSSSPKNSVASFGLPFPFAMVKVKFSSSGSPIASDPFLGACTSRRISKYCPARKSAWSGGKTQPMHTVRVRVPWWLVIRLAYLAWDTLPAAETSVLQLSRHKASQQSIWTWSSSSWTARLGRDADCDITTGWQCSFITWRMTRYRPSFLTWRGRRLPLHENFPHLVPSTESKKAIHLSSAVAPSPHVEVLCLHCRSVTSHLHRGCRCD